MSMYVCVCVYIYKTYNSVIKRATDNYFYWFEYP